MKFLLVALALVDDIHNVHNVHILFFYWHTAHSSSFSDSLFMSIDDLMVQRLVLSAQCLLAESAAQEQDNAVEDSVEYLHINLLPTIFNLLADVLLGDTWAAKSQARVMGQGHLELSLIFIMS